jgi:hypothetical protein
MVFTARDVSMILLITDLHFAIQVPDLFSAR